MEFHNKVNDATAAITNGLEQVELKLKDLTSNGFEKLQKALPDLFNRSGTVATARQNLLNRLGSISAYSSNNTNILGMNISQWSMLGNTLYDATQSFKNHTNDLAGVNTENKFLYKQEIYGNVALPGTVNTSSNVATANLSKTSYPSVNVGSTIRVNSVVYIVTGKTFSIHGSGTVSVDTTTNNVKVTTASVATLNLADVALSGTSTLKLVPGMYINVNNEIKQVESINAYGDFLTVTRAFRNSNTGASLGKEVGFTINTNFTTTNTDITVYRYDAFVCNSVCLDNVITGNGTTFTSVLSANDKIYYDDLEYFVESVTDTKITVDAPLRGKDNMVVYKVTDEQYVNRFTESLDDVLDNYSLGEQLFGADYMSNLTTKYRNNNGQYISVDAYNPTYVTSSLANGPAYMAAVNKTVQGLIDDLQNDAIRYMSDNELTLYLESKLNEIESLRQTIDDSIRQDLAAINAIKGLISGLLKLWKASCSKKKYGEEDVVQPDNEYLNSILVANPIRQGCDATTSNLPDLLDATDAELTSPADEPVEATPPIPAADTDATLFAADPDALFVLERARTAGDAGDILVDNDPENQQPPAVQDPCLQPC